MNQAEIERALQRCEVLSSAEPAELERLVERAQAESFAANQIVFEAQEPSTRVYVVAEGALHVRVGERLVSYADAGSLFGEYAMFVKGARTAQVVAAEASVLLSFDEEEFREFLLRCPSVMMNLLQTAVRRLHRVERQRG